jgi:drug/metabolite transporter (DMT)-like permease
MSLTPVAIVVLSFALFRDGVTSRQALGIAVSLAGAVTVLVRGDLAVTGIWLTTTTPPRPAA